MSDPEIDRLRCGTCGRVGEQHAEGDPQCMRDAIRIAQAEVDVVQAELATAMAKLDAETHARIATENGLGSLIDELRAEPEAAKSSTQHYKDREAHFAKVLGVTDGGKYRADWDSAIKNVLAQLEAAKKERDEALDRATRLQRTVDLLDATLGEDNALLAAARQSEGRLRAALETCRSELRNHAKTEMGDRADAAVEAIEEADAALAATAPDKVLPPHIEVELRQPERYYQDTGKRMRKLPYMALVGSPGDGPHRLRMREALGAVFQPGDRIWIIKAPAPDPQPQDKGGDALASSARPRGVEVAAGAGAEVKAPVPAQDLASNGEAASGGIVTAAGEDSAITGAERSAGRTSDQHSEDLASRPSPVAPSASASVAPAAAETGRSDSAQREPRSARFTVLADSEEATQDYILLDVPPAQARALFEKVQPVLAIAADGDPRDVLIGVHLEVEAHRQVYVDRDGTRSYPPSLLRNDIDPAPTPDLSALAKVRADLAACRDLFGTGSIQRKLLDAALAALDAMVKP